jgi:thiosulfate reductase cytochrome b subunit
LSDASIPGSDAARGTIAVHPGLVRLTHWINVVAMLTMISSGWRIYNASPLFDFTFPRAIAIGGWLAGGLQWHFAAMWLLVLNGVIYLSYGLIAGHYRRHFLPVSPASILREIRNTLRGGLSHQLGVYNPLQRTAYLGVIALGVLVVLSGLAIWKPVQLQWLAALMGGYEGARLVHFFCMAGFVVFVLIHVVMVLLVPRTFLPMLTGRTKTEPPEAP